MSLIWKKHDINVMCITCLLLKPSKIKVDPTRSFIYFLLLTDLVDQVYRDVGNFQTWLADGICQADSLYFLLSVVDRMSYAHTW